MIKNCPKNLPLNVYYYGRALCNMLGSLYTFVSVFLERRPSTVYGVYQTPTELLGTSQAFTGD